MRAWSLLLSALLFAHCTSPEGPARGTKQVYRSPELIVEQVTPNAFVHTSYKQTQDFGKVPCNGLVVRSGHEAIVFDTPTSDSSAAELIRWVQDSLHCRISAVIPTHFHDDCLGGLKAFHAGGIPTYAHLRTIALAAADSAEVPQRGFTDSFQLTVGNEQITATFHGEGHTKDNVVGYFPSEQVLFGGCLIKELGASKGYLGDANEAAWSGTVEAVKKAHPDVRVVVPGHGQVGNSKLLDYTIGLFGAQQ
ncbi:MAG TPA: subclass B1 metallo-beta-lactamase [Flavobacteriales bacterium]|nr:subclass B1 metallo-beta-lactamase [Flavobacteriales bacterium]HMR27748.1 subclass B1 metallo-beta-lactamase [Flavobacteriales bacterium]